MVYMLKSRVLNAACRDPNPGMYTQVQNSFLAMSMTQGELHSMMPHWVGRWAAANATMVPDD